MGKEISDYITQQARMANAKTPPKVAASELNGGLCGDKGGILVSPHEMEVMRGWVQYVQHNENGYLDEDDYLLTRRLYRMLNLPQPGWLLRGLQHYGLNT